MKRLLATLLLISVALIATPLYAGKLQKKSHELKSVAHRIQLLKKNLSSAKLKKKKILGSLKQTKVSLGKISNNIHYTSYQLSKQQLRLKKTRQTQQKLNIKLHQQKHLLNQQTRLTYLLSRQPYLKVLLNQQHPEQISRYLHYHLYLNKARSTLINQIKLTSASLTTLSFKIKHRSATLEQIHTQATKQLSRQTNKQIKNQRLLRATDHNLKTKQQRLIKLLADKKQLEKVIQTLRRKKLYGYVPGAKFSHMHHQLFWPVPKNRLLQSFGQLIEQGHLHSNGILVSAKPGTKVHSIFPGKVLYASWLRGYGLVIIEQHGRNYLTLYGHNESIFVKTGQTVKSGQTIAAIGNNGEFKTSALYFEIRYRGKPVNPLRWLRRK